METNANHVTEFESSLENRFMVFTIDGQDYAIEIRYVVEIIGVMPITVVPFLPDCMKGIINLRGGVIPLMDVRLRFALPEQEYTDRTCIIVLDNDGVQLGLIVDEVQEVLSIPEESRMPQPSSYVGESIRYIKGVGHVGKNVQLLLDCDKLMDIQG